MFWTRAGAGLRELQIASSSLPWKWNIFKTVFVERQLKCTNQKTFLLFFFPSFFFFQNEYYYEAKVPVYKFPEDYGSSLVTCFFSPASPVSPFKIDVTLEYLVIADEVWELGLMLRLWEKVHGIGDGFILNFVSIVSALKTEVLTFFNSMGAIADHLVMIFRVGKKLANVLEV